MDGTLWDYAAEVAESWNETVKRAGYDRKPITVKDIQSVMGKTMDVIARILFPDLEEGERQKLLAQCGEEENEYLRIHGATLYPDIRRTMEQLKKKISSVYCKQLPVRIYRGFSGLLQTARSDRGY